LSGDVEVGEDASFWFHTAARGDVNWMRIGARTNVQDGTVLHVTHERFPLSIGDDVVIGHGAIVHGARVGNRCLIGMGATVLSNTRLGDDVFIAAGAVVPPNLEVPDGMMVMGVPGKIVRPVSEKEREYMRWLAGHYVEIAEKYVSGEIREKD
jgi:carbonic anhydrase/acetyltransferase-like protein (isoleucine patch superfamily)